MYNLYFNEILFTYCKKVAENDHVAFVKCSRGGRERKIEGFANQTGRPGKAKLKMNRAGTLLENSAQNRRKIATFLYVK